MSANPRMSDFINDLIQAITIEGIEVADNETLAYKRPKIVTATYITNNLQIKYLSNICLCSVPIITLF